MSILSDKLQKTQRELIRRQLQKEYGLTVYTEDMKAASDEDFDYYPIEKDNLHSFAPILEALPGLTAAAVTTEAISRIPDRLYVVKFKSNDINPENLIQKLNNPKLPVIQEKDGKAAKLTELAPARIKESLIPVQTLNIAAAVFTVIATVTKTTYLRRINQQLNSISRNIGELLLFLNQEKQAEVRGNVLFLQETIADFDAIKGNKELKTLKLQRIEAIQQAALADINFYEDRLYNRLGKYVQKEANKRKLEEKELEELKENYYYYRLCYETYCQTKLLEIELIDNCSLKVINSAKTAIERHKEHFNTINSSLLSAISDYNLSKRNERFRMLLSEKLMQYGKLPDWAKDTIERAPASSMSKLLSLGGALSEIGQKKQEEILERVQAVADSVISREDLKRMDLYLDNVRMMNAVYSGNAQLIVNGNEVVLRLPKETADA